MGIRDFFYLQKTDRRLLLAVALGAGLLAAVLMLTDREAAGTDEAVVQQPADSVSRRAADGTGTVVFPDSAPPVRRAERFVFDPNTADSTALLRLGLQAWQVRNIYKYRAAGGIFRTKEDFARVYGLTQKEYRELEPYIRISADYQPAALLVAEKVVARDTLRFPVKLQEGETVDLSAADTTLLKRVPGIGSYYARRIVDYGRRLGGYVSVDQLDEIKDFPTEAKHYFVVVASRPQPLNLNALSVDELKRHPCLNYYQARAITDYRRKHGPLKSLDDLRLLPDFSEDQLRRLAPYVAF